MKKPSASLPPSIYNISPGGGRRWHGSSFSSPPPAAAAGGAAAVFLAEAVLAAPRCNTADKRALLQLKKGLGNPYTIITWVAGTDCCRSWYATECDPSTGRVTAVVILGMETAGPSRSRRPSSANLTGPLPTEIAKLTRLKMLWMDWNGLTGPVPAFLGRLAKLEYINLSFNKLSGAIPPSLGDLPQLGALFLDRNQLTGAIPEALGKLRQPDLYIRLSHNNLTGAIPQSFGRLNITKIDLSRNQLTGDASVLFAGSGKWTSIDLSRNLLEFDLSKAAAIPNIYSVDLNHNRIYGKIPPELNKLENLSFFNVSYNRLCGQIPQGGPLSSLTQYEFFHNRCLCGKPLPPCN
ncbi:unnamed protein product [Spirodela intermedia]|uniref:Leucine-rich repeat-containing N-terminal plant-type domain-containing protein n=1 Tax=Spirodela intermedia TaxID=51605 RepID=A0A7I8J3D8_SPIIN|nr:unnamed protein product [Spirodela intermedia]CAA6664628.1 unnamed protein product [Spirodela intermedia]